jgi:hypothetical protein
LITIIISLPAKIYADLMWMAISVSVVFGRWRRRKAGSDTPEMRNFLSWMNVNYVKKKVFQKTSLNEEQFHYI